MRSNSTYIFLRLFNKEDIVFNSLGHREANAGVRRWRFKPIAVAWAFARGDKPLSTRLMEGQWGIRQILPLSPHFSLGVTHKKSADGLEPARSDKFAGHPF